MEVATNAGPVTLARTRMATAHDGGPPAIEVATEDDLDWVYPNTTMMMLNGGHRIGLTVP